MQVILFKIVKFAFLKESLRYEIASRMGKTERRPAHVAG